MDVKTGKMMVDDPDVERQVTGVQHGVVFGREALLLSKAE
ncbi:hypothetical protein HDF12_004423 [Edaphobacter lichenicola]|uniref:Uncharacterized protein n=2 Tax=Tunturiibacter TaxID=3154218 RepID=A0A7Y9NR60_9BACT|nr:hypothetical protein [Edaphobacter lichenicola]NYF54024.1 hypothetical protein [Edaphobacter lichenicola]